MIDRLNERHRSLLSASFVERVQGGSRDDRGSVILAVLMVTLIVGLLGISMATNSTADLGVAGNYRASRRAFYAADGGVQATLHELVTRADELGGMPTDADLVGITPLTTENAIYTAVDVTEDGDSAFEPIQSGHYQGLYALSKPYSATVTAETTDYPPGTVTITAETIVDLIPVFQFALFFEGDLGLSPGQGIIVGGRVHSNAYAGRNPLQVEGVVTVVGDVYPYRQDGRNGGGQKLFRNAASDFVDLATLSSLDPNWHDTALERWDGNVRNHDHGVEPIHVPVPDPNTPRVLIEPPSLSDTDAERGVKYHYKADLRILNGVAVDRNGNPVSLVDPSTNENAIRPTVIWDSRENDYMLTLEIDLEKLDDAGAWPANGTIYVGMGAPGGAMPGWAVPVWNDAGSGFWDATAWPDAWSSYSAPYAGGNTNFAVKFTNGAKLAAPLTISSDNPVYIRGDFNATPKKPAAVIADAVTILSNNWGQVAGGGGGGRRRRGKPAPAPAGVDDDLAYSLQTTSNRRAATTSYNMALLVSMSANDYPNGIIDGGAHNLMRMLENWSSKTVNWKGSSIVLWISQYADGIWDDCCYYTVPYRNFTFDTDFLDPTMLPPHTPSLYQVRITDWRRE